MATVKCYTKGCRNRITPPHKANRWDLWCNKCHAAVDPTRNLTKRQKQEYLQQQFATRVFRDARAGKLQRL